MEVSDDHRSWRKRLLAFYPIWDVRDEVVPDDSSQSPQEHVARDAALARERIRAAGPDERPPALFRLWSNTRCLVVTQREERLPSFAAAARASAERGWPVVARDSGGTTVPHTPGTLLLTLLLPRLRAEDPPVQEPRADTVFTLLCDPVIEAMARLGVSATYGAVPRSFCDGRFNLVAHNRKIAGTAQRWRGGLPRYPVRDGFVMAHLALYVDTDMHAATRAVNSFLADTGSSEAFDSGQMISLREAMRRSGAGDPSSDVLRIFQERLVEVLRATRI